MRWWFVASTLLAACGRVDFDPRDARVVGGSGGPFTIDFTTGELGSNIELRRASPATYTGANGFTIEQPLPENVIGEVALGFDGSRYLYGWIRNLTLAAQ